MGLRVEVNKTSKTLDVYMGREKSPLQYPFLWLRDNCQCDRCFHPVSRARLFLMRNLTADIEITEAQVETPDLVRVTWSDGHQGSYSSTWLEERQFTDIGRQRRSQNFMRTPKLWNSELQGKVSKIDYKDLMNNDQTLYNWISELEETGINVITDAPQTEGVLHQIAGRVAFLRKTNYGEIFTVKAKLDPSNVAYTSATLGLHCDSPHLHYTPGIQMLHCIQQVPSKGGENTFTDGFYVARQMQKDFPGYFSLLSTISLDSHDVGTDLYKFHKMARASVFTLDSNRNVEKITYNNQMRDSVLNSPLEMVEPLYKAIIKWEELINDSKHTVNYKLKDGEIVCFHNYRVLHGREGYQAMKEGERHLEGGYIDWDEMRSRRRVLEQELGLSKYVH